MNVNFQQVIFIICTAEATKIRVYDKNVNIMNWPAGIYDLKPIENKRGTTTYIRKDVCFRVLVSPKMQLVRLGLLVSRPGLRSYLNLCLTVFRLPSSGIVPKRLLK